MANYISTWRTNYFRVKDEPAFRDFIERVGDVELVERTDNSGVFALIEGPDGDGGAPLYMLGDTEDPENSDTWRYFNDHIPPFECFLADHLARGEVAILMESGHEKLRYVSGYATAIRSDGEILSISLSLIYDAVEREWGIIPTRAEY